MTEQKQQGSPVTPEYLQKAMIAAINETWEGRLSPEKCTAIATAAQSFVALHQLEALQLRVAILEKQLVLQKTSINA